MLAEERERMYAGDGCKFENQVTNSSNDAGQTAVCLGTSLFVPSARRQHRKGALPPTATANAAASLPPRLRARLNTNLSTGEYGPSG